MVEKSFKDVEWKKKFTKKKIKKNIDKIINSKFSFKKKNFLFFTIKNVPNNDVRIKFEFNIISFCY